MKKDYKLYLVYMSVIFAVYFILVSQNYIMTDDYAVLDDANGGGGDVFKWDVLNGRPIYGIFQYFVQPYMISISRFAWLRLFSILSTIFFCCFMHRFLSSRINVSCKALIVYLPVFLVLSPPMVIYNSWAVCFPYVLSLSMAGISYCVIFNNDRKTTFCRFLAGVLILTCSFWIYQPTAMCFIYFVFLNHCIDNRKLQFSSLFLSAIGLAIAMLLAFLSVKILPQLLYGFTLNRGDLYTDIISKVHWFFHGPLKIAIYNYNVTPNIIYTIFSILLAICGCFYICKERQGILKLLLTFLMMVCIMAPSLLTKANWTASRSSIGLYFIVLTVILYGLISVYEGYIKGKISKVNINVFLVSILFIIGIYTQGYIYSGIIRQQQSEYQALTQEIVSRIPKEYSGKIRFDISHGFWNGFTTIHLSDEVGISSIQLPWALKGIARSIKQLKGLHYEIDNSNLVLKDNESCKDNCIVIDIGQVLSKSSVYN